MQLLDISSTQEFKIETNGQQIILTKLNSRENNSK